MVQRVLWWMKVKTWHNESHITYVIVKLTFAVWDKGRREIDCCTVLSLYGATAVRLDDDECTFLLAYNIDA